MGCGGSEGKAMRLILPSKGTEEKRGEELDEDNLTMALEVVIAGSFVLSKLIFVQ